MMILPNKENVFLKFFIEEQPIAIAIKKMLPKKFMHHHNDHNYATLQSTETNQEKIAPRKFG